MRFTQIDKNFEKKTQNKVLANWVGVIFEKIYSINIADDEYSRMKQAVQLMITNFTWFVFH